MKSFANKYKVYFFPLILILMLAKPAGQILRSYWTGVPSRFDLRERSGVTQVKEQAWGTCWAFATALSMESNLLVNKLTSIHNENVPPFLSPYYIDKYNGFTRKGDEKDKRNNQLSGQGSRFPGSNTDDPTTGLMVHQGGDYQVSTAFLTNTKGVVSGHQVPIIPRSGSHENFGDLPNEGILFQNNYQYYFPKEVQWLSLIENYDNRILSIKKSIMNHGAVGSAQRFDIPLGHTADGIAIYGSFNASLKLDHAINLIGWDDNLIWRGHKGAWIAQDSHHRTRDNKPLGRFYILYDDAFAAKDPLMGAVSFRKVIKTPFNSVYSHSLHGWRYSTSKEDGIKKVANRYIAQSNHMIKGVGFYTVQENTKYTIEIKSDLSKEALIENSGKKAVPGFYYIDLSQHKLEWKKDSELYAVLSFKNQAYAYDASSTVDILLKGHPSHKKISTYWNTPVQVNSRAESNESFYLEEGPHDGKNLKWKDFSKFVSSYNSQSKNQHAKENPTANVTLNIYVD